MPEAACPCCGKNGSVRSKRVISSGGEAFIKSRLRSKVILDCGHIADAEEQLDPTMPRPSRMVEDEYETPIRREARERGPVRRYRPEAEKPTAPKPASEPEKPKAPAPSINVSATASWISKILKGGK